MLQIGDVSLAFCAGWTYSKVYELGRSRHRGRTLMSDRSQPATQLAQKARAGVDLKELDEIYRRFRLVFVLTNLLTILLASYVILALLFPKAFEKHVMQQMQTIGLCVLLGGAILLSVVQWLCMRQTTVASRRKIEELTYIDALTTVYNYRYLDRRLEEELRIARRFHTPLSVIFMDVDEFKRVNDQFGHQVGNGVLSEIGAMLKVGARASDLIGRMGGDEFLVILPNTDQDEAQIVAERIRERLAEHRFKLNGAKTIDFLRASMGVACFPTNVTDKEGLVGGADQAMYRAKQAGGNRVCI